MLLHPDLKPYTPLTQCLNFPPFFENRILTLCILLKRILKTGRLKLVMGVSSILRKSSKIFNLGVSFVCLFFVVFGFFNQRIKLFVNARVP